MPGLLLAVFASIGQPDSDCSNGFRDCPATHEELWIELEQHAWSLRLEYHSSPEGEREYWLTTRFHTSAGVGGAQSQSLSEVGADYKCVLLRSVARVREARGLPPYVSCSPQHPSIADEMRNKLEARCWYVRTEFYNPPGATRPDVYRVEAKFFQDGMMGATVIVSEDSTLVGALRKALRLLP